jgi:N-methylhydantoinase A/oxoprolinase/acetone carboxylase beta subunit
VAVVGVVGDGIVVLGGSGGMIPVAAGAEAGPESFCDIGADPTEVTGAVTITGGGETLLLKFPV